MGSRNEFPTPEAWWRHLVSYGETDAMGIVYYGNYLHWFEQGRCNYLRELGMNYSEIENRGVLLPVREAYVRYLAPARFEQEVTVRAGISRWGRASLVFSYEIYNVSQDNKLMTTGYTHHACVSPQGRLVGVPEWLKQLCSG